MIERDRAKALGILHKHTESPALRRHAYAVEAAMRWYAEKLGEDPELYGVVGLLHDFDYEEHTTIPEHPLEGEKILKAEGYPESVTEAIKSHASEMGIPRDTNLRKVLFAVDELCGFVMAAALVLPSKSLADLTVESVRKKMKRKEFARAVKREDIIEGAEQLGLPLEEHIGNVIQALQSIRTTLDP
ncbi:MAG TPA: HD domain-containing protein [Armatimonadota bacterium]|jgi:putative nucleotidyltransferase with HDIG domain